VPAPELLRVQKWIVRNILCHIEPHEASVAYSRGSRITEAADNHCGCRWLIKLDVKNFFESINEVAVYRVFRGVGYQPLVSFELARICSRVPARWPGPSPRWEMLPREAARIRAYVSRKMGNLPQGAPTSPMLANLACRNLDVALQEIAAKYDLTYTRYADDIAFSTDRKDFSRSEATQVIGTVRAALGKVGLSPNNTKTIVAPPGARKIFLGLLVDSDTPRLTKSFKARIRQHLYYLTKKEGVSPAAHAKRRGFASVGGFRNHLMGLLAYASQVEPEYAAECQAKLSTVMWPL
jgi:hypothetical protein